jgi:carbonic anhydrase
LPFVAEVPTAHGGHQVHWEYTGEKGPAHWGELAEEFALCGSGTAQTPIDIVPTMREALTNPELHYQQGIATLVNNGHTVQANAAPGNSLTIDGERYALVQMHFHAPSEHTIAGQPAPLELHFVHKAADGTLAVIGMLVQEVETTNPAWNPLVVAMGAGVDGAATLALDWRALVPADMTTYRYLGSLTTPPCSEGVHWLVLQAPLELSNAQISAFTALYTGNARPLQERNERPVVADSSQS